MTIKRDPNRMEVPVHPGEVLLEDLAKARPSHGVAKIRRAS
jgi:plasmid maintenance system antidote protein VapI